MSGLTAEEKEQAKRLLLEEAEAFLRSDDDVGCISELEMNIKLTSDQPVQKNYLSIPRPLYPEVKGYIEDLLNRGFIRKSTSPFSSSVVCVRKKDGGMRLCIDYRGFGGGAHHGRTCKLSSAVSPVQEVFSSNFSTTFFVPFAFSSFRANFLWQARMKRSAVSGSGVSPDYKQARGDNLNMAASSPLNEESIQEEIEESDMAEPNLKDIHNLLKNIQGAITAMQGNIAKLAKDNNKLSSDVAELRKDIAKNNGEVEKLKEELISQNKYVASLELELARVKKTSKQQRCDIEDLQGNLDELEQYSRKNSLEFHGIPEDVGIPTDEVVCKVAQAVGVEMDPEKIEISHRLYRKKGIKPVIAKFANYKDKAKCYKARIRLKDVNLSTIFPSYSGTSLADQRVFINENLTGYRSEMMKIAIEKRRDEKILSTWSLDGKIFIKTSPSGRPRQMFSIDDVKEL